MWNMLFVGLLFDVIFIVLLRKRYRYILIVFLFNRLLGIDIINSIVFGSG